VKRFGHTIGDGANLPGARFAKVVETREDLRLDEARVKSWTGGDTVTIRPLYKNSLSFVPAYKLWMAFNHKPTITDDSYAMWRRMRLIPFLRKFDKHQADKKLLSKLRAEAPGILNWAIAGCLAWQRDGLGTPATVERATQEYEAESDVFGHFIEDRCVVDPSFKENKGALWGAYQVWCRDNQQTPISQKVIAAKMKTRGFGESKTGSVRYWTGCDLTSSDDGWDTWDRRMPLFGDLSIRILYGKISKKDRFAVPPVPTPLTPTFPSA
jgi:putative DNA primase/helicase